ncbi:MAG: pyrroline-5-carboxylate reductase [Acidimicrobiales bacterium]|nr:pyrroline-5-carboxylate reductase [Acidimicrobiales bacterium]
MGNRNLSIIGGGRLGSALVKGLIDQGFMEPRDIFVVEKDEYRIAELRKEIPGINVVPTYSGTEAVIFAVKPFQAEQACKSVADIHGNTPLKVLSVMAAIHISALETWLPKGAKVLRAMPNTPALLGEGVAGLVASESCGEEDVTWAKEVLLALGGVVLLEDESLLDVVTGLSGSGPAYVFLLAQYMIESGIELGLDEGAAIELVTRTVLGAGRMLVETGQSALALREMVTSPGGTTARGVEFLDLGGLKKLVKDAIEAASQRSVEMWEEMRPS